MGRLGVTYEEVERVCEQLRNNGVTPNQRNVRAELGTGSASTILKHIQNWTDNATSERLQSVQVPQSVLDSISFAIADAVSEAISHRDEMLQDAKAQLSDTLTSLEKQEQDNSELISQVEINRNNAEQREIELQKMLSAKETQNEELSSQVEKLTEKMDLAIKGQESARTELAKSQMQIERADKATLTAEQHNIELKEELSQIKAKLIKAESIAITSNAVSEEQTKTINRLDKEIARFQKSLVEEQEINTGLRTKIDDLRQFGAVAQEQSKSIIRLEKEISAAATKYEALTEKYELASRAEATALTELKLSKPEKSKKQ